jgi:hypothetical protein
MGVGVLPRNSETCFPSATAGSTRAHPFSFSPSPVEHLFDHHSRVAKDILQLGVALMDYQLTMRCSADAPRSSVAINATIKAHHWGRSR